MCAYLEGYKFELEDATINADDKTRNGFITHLYCLEHTKEPVDRDHEL